MFSAEVLNSDATLNNFVSIGTLNFIPGEEIDLILRLKDTLKNLRYILPVTTVVTATFNLIDGTTLEKTMTLWTDDRSIMEVTLEESETENLSGGTITLELDLNGDGSTIKKVIIRGALGRESTTC